MQPSNWLAIALGVLPPLPCKLASLRVEGGSVQLSLLEIRDGELWGTVEQIDAKPGIRLTIPLETADRGGYAVECTITQTYFLGGRESGASLTVDEVRRRKPYRVKERVESDATATLHVISSTTCPDSSVLLARLLDISSSGVGISTDQRIEPGDRFQIDTVVQDIQVVGQITAVQSSRMAFGRWRVGCRFSELPPHTQAMLDRLTGATV
jgi:hypothetical protein